MSKSNLTTNKTLDLTFKLLDSFANEGTSMTIADISRFLDVSRVTAQTMVNSLELGHYIEKDPLTGKYSSGYMLFALGKMYLYRYPFLRIAEKYVLSYYDTYDIKINISIIKPDGTTIILLSKDKTLIPNMMMGNLVPANVSASGKVLLSSLAPHVQNEMLNTMTLAKFTDNSICDKPTLKKELDKIKKQGFAEEHEELVLTRSCLAAPIFDISGNVIAAVSFSADTSRIKAEREDLIEKVILLSRTISGELGYQTYSA